MSEINNDYFSVERSADGEKKLRGGEDAARRG